MPRRAITATREYLKQVPLPQHANSYTVITHETVINNALEQLKLKGFKVTDEKYRANNLGDVAVGVYQLTYGDDPELGMMFAWANSYDKTMRFKCAVGGFVKVSGSSIISQDFAWGRKHTGTADQEMIAQMNNQIMNGQIYYDEIVVVKEEMKKIILDEKTLSEFLGRAFFTEKLFTKEQIGIIRDEIQKPSFDYTVNGDIASLWTNYNHMLVALKKAHPRTWMDEQRDLHKYVCQEFGLSNLGTTIQVPFTGTTVNVQVLSDEPIQHPGGVYEYKVKLAEDQTPGLPVIDLTPEKPVEKMNLEEFAEVKQDSQFKSTITKPEEPTEEMFNTEVEIMAPNHTIGVPNEPAPESDITPEQQKQIDDAIKNLEKVKIKAPSLTLPD